MDFLELARKRYSARSYTAAPVEAEKLNKVLKAIQLAPSACNRQPFQVIVIYTKGREEELRRIYRAPWFVQAPIILCICALPAHSWYRQDGRSYCEVDATIAMDHAILAATDLGLGTCWIGAFDLKLPEQFYRYRMKLSRLPSRAWVLLTTAPIQNNANPCQNWFAMNAGNVTAMIIGT
jgi:nitroreductase